MDHNPNTQRPARPQHRRTPANAPRGEISVVSAVLTGRRSRSVASVLVALVVALTTVVTVAASIVNSHISDTAPEDQALLANVSKSAADGAKTVAPAAETEKKEAESAEGEKSQTEGKTDGKTDGGTDKKTADRDEEKDADERSLIENDKKSEAKAGAYTVTIAFDERENFVGTTDETTLGEYILASGVALDSAQLANLDLDAKIDADMTFYADRITYDSITEDEYIPYETVYRDSTDIAAGTQSVLQAGVNGVMTKSYDVKYVNGVETVRIQTGSWVSTAAQDQIILNGVAQQAAATPTPTPSTGTTAGANGLPAETVYESGYVTGSDGVARHYYAYLDVSATCYNAGGTTASGYPADEHVIGVGRYDGTLTPIIPFGTRCYVMGDYADCGERIAADYGYMFGNKIDVCLYPSNPIYANFGWRPMRVYFLD